MGRNAIFIAGLIVFDGAAVAWAAWEFWRIRPGKTDEPIKTDEPEPPSAFSRPRAGRSEAPGHPEGEHGPDHG